MQYQPLVPTDTNKNLPVVSTSLLQKYLKEIEQFEVLSCEESHELAVRFVDHGDHDAAKQLIVSNLRLVVKIVLEHQRYWQSNFLDLIQEGNAGLVKAIKKFDPYRGVKFTSYASYWIKAYIFKFIMDNWRLVKIGTTQTMRRMFFSFYKEKKHLELQDGKADNDTLAKRLHVKQEQLAEIRQRLCGSDSSVNVPMSDGSSQTVQDTMPQTGPSIEETVERRELQSKLHNILEKEKNNLSARENFILFHRLLSESPYTLQEIGDIWQISRERVRQIEAKLLKYLKEVFFRELGDQNSWA